MVDVNHVLEDLPVKVGRFIYYCDSYCLINLGEKESIGSYATVKHPKHLKQESEIQSS